MTGRLIRPSQFVLTYGVGSIIETVNGSRIVPSFDRWGRYLLANYQKYEIDDASALSQLRRYRDQPKIFKIPTNSELRQKDSKDVYSLDVFPRWAVCMAHEGAPVLGKMDDRGRFACPYCARQNLGQSRATGVRFVTACPAGHLDDVDWQRFVPKTVESCRHDEFEWLGEGKNSRNLEVHCKKCRTSVRLSELFKMSREDKLECPRRFPERGERRDKTCGRRARLLLRNSSNLRVPVVQVTLTIPYRDGVLYRILSTDTMYSTVSDKEEWTVKELCERLRAKMRLNKKITERQVQEIERHSDRELADVLQQLFRDKTGAPTTEDAALVDEFTALNNASNSGHPPEHSGRRTTFEVEKRRIDHIPADKNRWHLPFVVAPVKTLNVVMVQRGYRREIGELGGETVLTYLEDENGNSWFPGIEAQGEGIFLRLEEGVSPPRDESWDGWARKYRQSGGQPTNHPLFVWWHSLAHRLITTLSIDSGYSSSSIRERVYVKVDPENPEKAKGGILLYAAQAGGDGTLGGLIALATKFGPVLDRAAANIHSCSNDPLCSGNRVSPSRMSGAACYACLLVSETSCEHRNSILDRNILRCGV